MLGPFTHWRRESAYSAADLGGDITFETSNSFSRMSRVKRLLPVAAIVAIVLASAAFSGPLALAAARSGNPTITLQPQSVDLYQGQNAVFTAAAAGAPVPTVAWQLSRADGAWQGTGVKTAQLTVSHVTVALNGNRYRAVFTNSAGRADSQTALLTVAVTRLAKVVLSPAATAITVGGNASYHAEGFNSNGVDLGDVTSTTTFSIAPAGSCTGAICTPSIPGPYTVTGTNGLARGTASLTVMTAIPDRLVLSPPAAWTAPDEPATFSAQAFDSAGDDLGNVTASTIFTIDGSNCDGDTCESSIGGGHTITGTYDGASGSAALTVVTSKFVELLFSRTEETAADNCLRDDTDVAPLDTMVAPYLQSLGFSATGSIETGPTQQSSFFCTHYQSTLATSWDLAQELASTYGWTFISHSSSYPTTWPTDPGEQWDETCGSAQVIDSHGLPGADAMFAWPHNQIDSSVLTQFVEPCFGTSRVYRNAATDVGTFSTPPYDQNAWQLGGGCLSAITRANQCGPVVIDGSTLTYQDPQAVIDAIEALPPGQVITLQVYLLVTGKSPSYATSQDQWDCTSPDPADHWSNDTERYCYSDFQEIMQALYDAGMTITQPLAVDAAFGRTEFADTAVARP
jgi:hypothetical protein